MRHNSSLSIFLVLTLVLISQTSFASEQKSKSTTTNHSTKKLTKISVESVSTGMSKPIVPVTEPEEDAKKTHSLKMDELAHIHHFHKERVKKIKRHHKKYWMMSKLLLILCHLVLLICAYMHVVH